MSGVVGNVPAFTLGEKEKPVTSIRKDSVIIKIFFNIPVSHLYLNGFSMTVKASVDNIMEK